MVPPNPQAPVLEERQRREEEERRLDEAMDDVAASVLLAHELMSSRHLYAVARPERRTDGCSIVGSLRQIA